MSSSETKSEAIITAARGLFWKFGVKRVSVEQICEAAGCSKMTFYRNFTNKVEVARKVLLQIVAESDQRYFKIMEEPIHFHEKMRKLVQLKSDFSKDISMEFVSDIINSDEPELTTLLTEMRETNQKRFRDDIKQAQKDGDVRSDLKVDFILALSDRITHLATDQSLSVYFNTPQELIMALTDVFFFGIDLRNKE